MNIYSLPIGLIVLLFVYLFLSIRGFIEIGKVLPKKIKNKYAVHKRLFSLISISYIKKNISVEDFDSFNKARKIYIFHTILMVIALAFFLVFLLVWKNEMLKI